MKTLRVRSVRTWTEWSLKRCGHMCGFLIGKQRCCDCIAADSTVARLAVACPACAPLVAKRWDAYLMEGLRSDGEGPLR